MIAGITGSNSSEGMDVGLLCLLCVVQLAVWRRDDHSLRGVVCACVCACLIVCDIETSRRGGLGRSWAVASQRERERERESEMNTERVKRCCAK